MWFVRGDTGLTPDKLDQILDASCGNRPTVALISACYSGIFIGPLAQPNRVVLTAASATNTSFGCSPEATYTYWDGCLIDNFARAGTWEDLYGQVTACIEGKESAAGLSATSSLRLGSIKPGHLRTVGTPPPQTASAITSSCIKPS